MSASHLLRVVGFANRLRADPLDGGHVITHDELLADLQDSKTDLARVVEAVIRDRVPYIVVPSAAVKAWERREPHHWAKVSAWLAAQNVVMVQV